MGRRTKIAIGVLGGLAVLLGAAYLVLIASPNSPEGCVFHLDLEKARVLAKSLEGELPSAVRVEAVTSSQIPRAFAAVGAPWKKATMQVYAYQVVFPGRTIVVDAAMNRAQAETIGMVDSYDEAAWGRVAKALAAASAVYVTHEHADHLGGVFAALEPAELGRVHLTTEQLASQVRNIPTISTAARAALVPLQYDGMTAVAPGVVLIKAPGHTPGSQMVFITRADGTELILTGDTAWLMENVETEQGPARFVALIIGSRREETACQLRDLHKLTTVLVMPGHDSARMKELLDRGGFVSGFQL